MRICHQCTSSPGRVRKKVATDIPADRKQGPAQKMSPFSDAQWAYESCAVRRCFSTEPCDLQSTSSRNSQRTTRNLTPPESNLKPEDCQDPDTLQSSLCTLQCLVRDALQKAQGPSDLQRENVALVAHSEHHTTVLQQSYAKVHTLERSTCVQDFS